MRPPTNVIEMYTGHEAKNYPAQSLEGENT
jgi:hypothetical protein